MRKGHLITKETKEKIRLSAIGNTHGFKKGYKPFNKGIKMSKEYCEKLKGRVPWNKGKTDVYSDEVIKKMSESRKGKVGWSKDKKLSKESLTKRTETRRKNDGYKSKNKGKPNLKMRGVNHPNWKGGITTENHKIRTSLEYKLWRESVFKRDNWTCVWCGKRGGVIHADHIKPFAYYPELRLAIDNGRTLCIDCHKTTDTFASKGRLIMGGYINF